MIRLLIYVGLLLCCFACNPSPFYQETHELPADGWSYADTQEFEFEITDTLKRYNLSLMVDHSTAYEFQNLYIQLVTIFPNADTLMQPISFNLADPQGRWHGDCGSKSCQVEISLQENAFFEQVGKYQISINQHMRIDPVSNIRSLKLILNERIEN